MAVPPDPDTGIFTKLKMTRITVMIVLRLPFANLLTVSCHCGTGAKSAAARMAAIQPRAGKRIKARKPKKAVRIHSKTVSMRLPGVFMSVVPSCWTESKVCILF